MPGTDMHTERRMDGWTGISRDSGRTDAWRVPCELPHALAWPRIRCIIRLRCHFPRTVLRTLL